MTSKRIKSLRLQNMKR